VLEQKQGKTNPWHYININERKKKLHKKRNPMYLLETSFD